MESNELIASYANLGASYAVQKSYQMAEMMYKRGLECAEEYFGGDSENVITPLMHLAGCFTISGRLADAEPCYKRIPGRDRQSRKVEGKVLRRKRCIALPGNHSKRLRRIRKKQKAILSMHFLYSCPASKVLGAARGDEHGAALALSRQGAAGARTARSGLRLVHRRFRHARSEGREGAAGGVGVMTVC